jgi:REP element-mobilizing transposase RayT
MPFDPERHHRRSIRLSGYDYRRDGAYFVTICTRERVCVFGEVAGTGVRHSRRGLIAAHCWNEIPIHRPYVTLDEFVVMPNHVHGLFWIEAGLCRGDTCVAQEAVTRITPADERPHPAAGSVGAVVGSYKAAVSREINRLRPGAARDFWQPNYYEHIVRTDQALETIRHYIRTNPERWGADAYNPVGDGTDDIETFMRFLVQTDRPVKGGEGDTSAAPTGEEYEL